MKKAVVSGAVVAAMSLSACAQRADSIAPAYVSTMQYDGVDCVRMNNEATRVANRLNTLSGQQNSKATADAVLTGVGLVVFWPALLLMAVPDDADTNAAEIGRLKGEAEALQAAYQAKGCGMHAS